MARNAHADEQHHAHQPAEMICPLKKRENRENRDKPCTGKVCSLYSPFSLYSLITFYEGSHLPQLGELP